MVGKPVEQTNEIMYHIHVPIATYMTIRLSLTVDQDLLCDGLEFVCHFVRAMFYVLLWNHLKGTSGKGEV